MKYKIGFLPAPLYFLLLISYILAVISNTLPKDFLGAIGVLIVFSLILEEIGKKIPLLNKLGGKVLLVTFFPSYLVYRNLIPKDSLRLINDFMGSSNFLSLFIVLIVVGSLLSMNRTILINSTMKIFLALVLSQVTGIIIGCGFAVLLGFDIKYALLFIIVPVMAGGVGEGALPLSIGYASMLGMEQGVVFAQILPCVFIGGLFGVFYASVLNQLGKKIPSITGNGILVKQNHDVSSNTTVPHVTNLNNTLSAFVLAILLYFISNVLHKFLGLPVPIIVLLVVIIAKVINCIPKNIESGCKDLYKFTVTALSPLLLFGVGVTMTPWEELIQVFSNYKVVLLLFIVVSAIVVSGFLFGRMTGLHEIDSAIVISCCSGQGGTGALAILAAGERMELMPFAQVAVRIGGAIVVTTALNLLRIFN